MLPVILITGLLVGVSSPGYQEFSRHSNGNASYQISFVADCPTGKRDTGYALAPGKFVLFKQRGHDGSVGNTCLDMAGK
ncbi:MAG: hypothetical protein ACPGHX_04595 [Candidatus Puniceispirillaceae bacterium]